MCRIMINDMSSRMAVRSVIRGRNGDEGNDVRRANATAISREIQTRRNDIVDIKQEIQIKENKISQIDKKIALNDKKIDHIEKRTSMEQDLLDSGKSLLKDLVESRDMQKTHIDTLIESRNLLQGSLDLGRKQERLIEGKISLLSKMADVVKALLKIKQAEVAKSANSPMKDASQPLPEKGQAASVVTSQQPNDMSAKSIDSILRTAAKKGVAKPLTKSDYKSLRAGAEKIAYNTLGKDNKYTRDISLTNEPEESYSRFSSMFKAYRAEMKSIDRMFSFLRIKV